MILNEARTRKWIAGEVMADCDDCEEDRCGDNDDSCCTAAYKIADRIITYLRNNALEGE